ncbi:hypothetical protein GJAV_G00110490 [Gymnothorax javanicus]|nr:hypothetical protein GJAV_G00110490 [Gymnothorax javanicus]
MKTDHAGHPLPMSGRGFNCNNTLRTASPHRRHFSRVTLTPYFWAQGELDRHTAQQDCSSNNLRPKRGGGPKVASFIETLPSRRRRLLKCNALRTILRRDNTHQVFSSLPSHVQAPHRGWYLECGDRSAAENGEQTR